MRGVWHRFYLHSAARTCAPVRQTSVEGNFGEKGRIKHRFNGAFGTFNVLELTRYLAGDAGKPRNSATAPILPPFFMESNAASIKERRGRSMLVSASAGMAIRARRHVCAWAA